MTKNKLSDLNNHLFEQLEKLNDDSLVGEKLKEEIDRSKAMTGISSQILNSAKLTIMAAKIVKSEGIILPEGIAPEDHHEMKRLVGLDSNNR